MSNVTQATTMTVSSLQRLKRGGGAEMARESKFLTSFKYQNSEL